MKDLLFSLTFHSTYVYYVYLGKCENWQNVN